MDRKVCIRIKNWQSRIVRPHPGVYSRDFVRLDRSERDCIFQPRVARACCPDGPRLWRSPAAALCFSKRVGYSHTVAAIDALRLGSATAAVRSLIWVTPPARNELPWETRYQNH